MSLLILESGRDDMLQIYHRLIISKGINISFGLFKSILLEHLTQNGGIRNLSLASNYYLAGVAKYYFNGDLTENKDLALFHDYLTNAQRTQMTGAGESFEQNHEDIWKKDVCKKLNVLIKILRDSYIDSVGTAFEVPEDFGDIPIKKLFSKYGAKIRKALGIDDEEEPTTEPEIDNNPNVGNGYTFEIMYSHDDCKKYYEATSPGAWCITYGENHFNSYANGNWSTNYRKIHYVIFRKNGWENVERVPIKSMWKGDGKGNKKPQDTYGNSLIALLQSNDSWEPICITSRWNHGAGDSGPVDADHAYSTEEFMQITGVNQADLERIYEIWKINNEKFVKNKKLTSKEKKQKILALKEIQIRLNGGASPDSLLSVEKIVAGNLENLRKSVFIGSVKNSRENFFIVDKCKIIFDSINEPNTSKFTSTQDENNLMLVQNMIFCDMGTYYIAYDYRKHSILNIGGVYKFKAVPLRNSLTDGNPMFYEVKTSNTCIALVSVSGNNPLKLPNGEYWFNEIHVKSRYASYYSYRNKVRSFFVGDDSNGMIEIIYDSSSREKYFYLLKTKQFIEFPDFEKDIEFAYDDRHEIGDEPVIADCDLGRNYFAIQYCDKRWNFSRWGNHLTPIQLYRLNGSRIIVNGFKYFYDVVYLGNDFFLLSPYKNGDVYDVYEYRRSDSECIFYNAVEDKVYTLMGHNIKCSHAECCGYVTNNDTARIIMFELEARQYGTFYLFDKVEKKFIYNTYRYPSPLTFRKRSALKADGSHMSFFKDMSDRHDYGYDSAQAYVFFVDVVEGITYETDTQIAVYSYGDNEYEKIKKKNIQPIKYIE